MGIRLLSPMLMYAKNMAWQGFHIKISLFKVVKCNETHTTIWKGKDKTAGMTH